ncbi:class I SAM-dependent methyltransferase [Natronosalvus caseinilyticus]|uniref:class I SAM-dependent methyltransferase n=1 Tax=Natronosalvus caseinilyticus TaxID=2953747 RepID=UPI0028A7B457|nr:class I SAM-dependent methyltransferase [Natronosalvus caseinilyticus]
MADRNAVRRSYDELSPVYAAQRSDDGPGTRVLERFLGSLENPQRVLDAGCGQGTPVLSRLAETTTAVGLDFSREQLRLATDAAPGADLLQGDMTTLPLEESSFDAVVAYWSLIHVPLEAHGNVIDEFARVLRPGGRLLLCEGTNAWTGENPDWLESGVEMAWEIAGAEATRGQLQEAGFEVLEEWGVPEEFADNDGEGKDEYGEDNGSEGDGEDEGHPWTFFVARLDRA